MLWTIKNTITGQVAAAFGVTKKEACDALNWNYRVCEVLASTCRYW